MLSPVSCRLYRPDASQWPLSVIEKVDPPLPQQPDSGVDKSADEKAWKKWKNELYVLYVKVSQN